jgi:hypothetical protein
VEEAQQEFNGAIGDAEGWRIALQRKEGCISNMVYEYDAARLQRRQGEAKVEEEEEGEEKGGGAREGVHVFRAETVTRHPPQIVLEQYALNPHARRSVCRAAAGPVQSERRRGSKSLERAPVAAVLEECRGGQYGGACDERLQVLLEEELFLPCLQPSLGGPLKLLLAQVSRVVVGGWD